MDIMNTPNVIQHLFYVNKVDILIVRCKFWSITIEK